MKLLLASNNPKKLVELQRLVAGAELGIEVLGLGQVSRYPEPIEDGSTFTENALLKARAALAHTGLPALADDSGLTVDALNGMPGVLSARWAGPQRSDAANNALLLAQLAAVPVARRTAKFVAAVAFVAPAGLEEVRTGELDGEILPHPRGAGGFGYDPLFRPRPGARSLAELSASEKDSLSHRGRALRALLPVVASYFS